jgi:hypothetical protein
MENERSDGHRENADFPKKSHLEPGSNVTVDRASQLKKQYWQTLSTEEGMQMAESKQHLWNTPAPMHVSLDPDSNAAI